VQGTSLVALHLFPEELWDTLDPSRRSTKGPPGRRGAGRGKQRAARIEAVGDGDEEGEGGERKGGADEDENAEADEDEERDPEEENPEDDFSNDDSEMGGDYNAENYFDDGGGEDDGDAGGGGGDGDGGGFD